MALLKSKDDIPDEDIQEMLEEYYRIAKLKGITTDKPDPPSDSSDDEDDDDEEGGANPPPPPPPTRPTVKSPPTTKRAGGPGKNSSIKSPTKSQTATIPEDEKWIDYRGTKKQNKKKITDTLGQNSTFYPKIISLFAYRDSSSPCQSIQISFLSTFESICLWLNHHQKRIHLQKRFSN